MYTKKRKNLINSFGFVDVLRIYQENISGGQKCCFASVYTSLIKYLRI